MAPLSERDINLIIAAATAPKTSSNTGTKRKSDGPPAIDPDDIDLYGTPIDWNANQVRSKIRSYLNSGEVKIGEFQSKIGVTSKGFNDFMKQSGPTKGTGSNTYLHAFDFFKKRELAGVKIPRKKQKTAEPVNGSDGKDKYDVSDVHLDGEDVEMVPIYDTCDDIRKKINAHLRNAPTTNAGFVRQIAETFPEPGGVAARHLAAFLSKNGPNHGADSPIYYAAYVYFEKLRIKDKRPKGKKREEMEQTWGGRGVERRKAAQRMWMGSEETWTIDQYGKHHIR